MWFIFGKFSHLLLHPNLWSPAGTRPGSWRWPWRRRWTGRTAWCGSAGRVSATGEARSWLWSWLTSTRERRDSVNKMERKKNDEDGDSDSDNLNKESVAKRWGDYWIGHCQEKVPFAFPHLLAWKYAWLGLNNFLSLVERSSGKCSADHSKPMTSKIQLSPLAKTKLVCWVSGRQCSLFCKDFLWWCTLCNCTDKEWDCVGFQTREPERISFIQLL